jgi:hypothetical protein
VLLFDQNFPLCLFVLFFSCHRTLEPSTVLDSTTCQIGYRLVQAMPMPLSATPSRFRRTGIVHRAVDRSLTPASEPEGAGDVTSPPGTGRGGNARETAHRWGCSGRVPVPHRPVPDQQPAEDTHVPILQTEYFLVILQQHTAAHLEIHGARFSRTSAVCNHDVSDI